MSTPGKFEFTIRSKGQLAGKTSYEVIVNGDGAHAAIGFKYAMEMKPEVLEVIKIAMSMYLHSRKMKFDEIEKDLIRNGLDLDKLYPND